MSQIRRHLLISGRVQGVFFRQSTRQSALKNGLSGWVCNLPDGRVEVVIEGERSAVEATIDWCRSGPELSHVEQIAIEKQTVTGEFDNFSIR